MLDNVFRGGAGARRRPTTTPQRRATRELNDPIAADERVDIAMLAVADGITLARKR